LNKATWLICSNENLTNLWTNLFFIYKTANDSFFVAKCFANRKY